MDSKTKKCTGVDLFFRKREKKFVDEVFDQLKDPASNLLPAHNFKAAMVEFGMWNNFETDDAASEFFLSMDIDNDNGLNREEFERAIQTPGELEQWTATIPLHQLLASCLSMEKGVDPLRSASSLDGSEKEKVEQLFHRGFQRLFSEYLRKLKHIHDEIDKSAKIESEAQIPVPRWNLRGICPSDSIISKFTFEPSTGTIENFHDGLKSRVGAPNIKNVIMKTMRKEHCEKAGHDQRFTTGNYGITTWPAREWAIAAGTESCPDEDLRMKSWNNVSKVWESDVRARVIRKVRTISALRVENEKLVNAAMLQDEEIMAVSLYTGPMFVILNLILRRYPAKKDEKGYPYYEFFEERGNLYATTIFVLVSAIQKIAQVMKLPPGLKLYRGLGGDMRLPEHFYKADKYGRRGIVEWGFLSTTSSKDAAIHYSGAKQGKALPTLFQTTASSVDRGACIKDLSQYPEEVEYLWVPCSFLELEGGEVLEMTEDGIVKLISLRINANLKAKKLDELLTEKKSMHLESFEHLLQEMKRDFDDYTGDQDVQDYLTNVLNEAKAKFDRHHASDASLFNDEQTSKNLTIEVLAVQSLYGTIKKNLQNT